MEYYIFFTVLLVLNICGMEYLKITYPSSSSMIKDLWNGILNFFFTLLLVLELKICGMEYYFFFCGMEYLIIFFTVLLVLGLKICGLEYFKNNLPFFLF